jgi:hypothetical protein
MIAHQGQLSGRPDGQGKIMAASLRMERDVESKTPVGKRSALTKHNEAKVTVLRRAKDSNRRSHSHAPALRPLTVTNTISFVDPTVGARLDDDELRQKGRFPAAGLGRTVGRTKRLVHGREKRVRPKWFGQPGG